jgi:hydroxymethylbilane synthase
MSARAKLRLGTRGSDLARTQSGTIAASLERLGFAVELTIIKTSGDQNTTALFGSIGPQGVFVREIEQALVERRVDVAVHSFKDLPTKSPAELTVGAIPQRVDPADLLLVRRDAFAGMDARDRATQARAGMPEVEQRREQLPGAVAEAGAADAWLPLKPGARVGTASARRRAWLAHFRPDLRIEPLRGNVPTRIRKLEEGNFDAILLAAAGVERLQAEQRLGSELDGIAVLRRDPQRFVPAPAQGALAVQCRRDDERVLAALAQIDDAPSRLAVTAERDALARAEGGCDVAFGAYCRSGGGNETLIAMLERGGKVHVASAAGDPATLGAAVWAKLAAAAS